MVSSQGAHVELLALALFRHIGFIPTGEARLVKFISVSDHRGLLREFAILERHLERCKAFQQRGIGGGGNAEQMSVL